MSAGSPTLLATAGGHALMWTEERNGTELWTARWGDDGLEDLRALARGRNIVGDVQASWLAGRERIFVAWLEGARQRDIWFQLVPSSPSEAVQQPILLGPCLGCTGVRIGVVADAPHAELVLLGVGDEELASARTYHLRIDDVSRFKLLEAERQHGYEEEGWVSGTLTTLTVVALEQGRTRVELAKGGIARNGVVASRIQPESAALDGSYTLLALAPELAAQLLRGGESVWLAADAVLGVFVLADGNLQGEHGRVAGLRRDAANRWSLPASRARVSGFAVAAAASGFGLAWVEDRGDALPQMHLATWPVGGSVLVPTSSSPIDAPFDVRSRLALVGEAGGWRVTWDAELDGERALLGWRTAP